MASGSSRTKSPFTFTWTINNFHGETVVSLESPVYIADPIDQTKWSLSLLVPAWNSSAPGHVTCVLQREKDDSRQGGIYIDFMISFMDQEGVLRSVREDGCYFGMNLGNAGDGSCRVCKNLVQIKTLVDNFEKYVPDNTLTLRCRMWKSGGSVSRNDLCFARTIIDIEKRSFIWTIEDISFISPGEKRTIHVPSYNKGSSSLQLNLSLKQNYGEEVFSIEMYEVENLRHLHCEISNMNGEGKNVDTWRNTLRHVSFVDKKCLLFQTFIRKSELIEDQKRLLTNGALILQCDFQLSFGVAWSQIENYRQELFEIAAAAENDRTTTSSSPPCHSSCSSKKVLKHLLNEGTLSDITLRAGTKSFPVHKSILSARSLIFRSKFIKEEEQNPNRVMELSDIDEITLRSLLLYIYTDVVEDLNFGNALELYQSAEKYQLMDLKDICVKFLMDNLSISNIFQVLSFANVYQDNKMKKAAQDFISELGNEFTDSDQWKDFKKRNLELALETMEYMYSRKRQKTVRRLSKSHESHFRMNLVNLSSDEDI